MVKLSVRINQNGYETASTRVIYYAVCAMIVPRSYALRLCPVQLLYGCGGNHQPF